MNRFEAATIRTLRTAIQTALGMLGASSVIQALDWQTIAGASGLAALISLLQGLLVALPEVDMGLPIEGADQ